jgi:rhodanese-related sulfurtransferase
MASIAPINAAEAAARVQHGALLVDVRSPAGRASAGLVPEAVIVAKDDVAVFADTQPTDRQIVVFCGSTDGSGPFVDYLDAHGFTDVAHIDGGFAALKATGARTEPPVE